MCKAKGFITGAILLALVLIFGSIGLACVAAPATPPLPAEIPANYTTYTDESGLFSISYPADWEVDQTLMEKYKQGAKNAVANIKADIPVEGTTFIFLGGRRITATEYMPHLFILVEPIPIMQPTLDGAIDIAAQSWRTGYPDYLELSRIKTTVDGREAIIFEWQGTLQGKQNKLHYLQLYTLADITVWVATCTSLSGDFAQWQNDFNTILRSLRISR